LTEKHEALSDEFVQYFDLEQEELNKNDLLIKAVQSLTINELRKDKLIKKYHYVYPFELNLEKGENVIWVFEDVKYYLAVLNNIAVIDGEAYLAKNPHYSKKNYKRYQRCTIKSKESICMAEGDLIITNKNLLFTGRKSGFKINLNEIVSISQYDDGVEMQRGSMVDSPILFQTNDGWFTYELIKGLTALDEKIRNP